MSVFDDVALVDLDGTSLEDDAAGEEIPPVLGRDEPRWSTTCRACEASGSVRHLEVVDG